MDAPWLVPAWSLLLVAAWSVIVAVRVADDRAGRTGAPDRTSLWTAVVILNAALLVTSLPLPVTDVEHVLMAARAASTVCVVWAILVRWWH